MESMQPEDVLAYLNMLGYTNISVDQLKEFMKDLKKLIKYDLKHNNGNVDFLTSAVNGTENNFLSQRNIEDIYNGLFAQSTVSSEARKVVPPKEKHIAVHITKKHKKPENRVKVEKPRSETPETNKPEQIPNLCIETELNLKSGTSSKSCDQKSTSSKTTPCRKCTTKTKQVNKRDPVALYQYYQSEWNKNRLKIPGQDDHSDLRWAVREKLRGGPPVEVPLTNKTSCRRVSTHPRTYLL
nr:unnamed protein product [Callosobruchus chinensis]